MHSYSSLSFQCHWKRKGRKEEEEEETVETHKSWSCEDQTNLSSPTFLANSWVEIPAIQLSSQQTELETRTINRERESENEAQEWIQVKTPVRTNKKQPQTMEPPEGHPISILTCSVCVCCRKCIDPGRFQNYPIQLSLQ